MGASKDPYKISLGEWERFIDARRTGAIDGRGNQVPEGKRRTVGARAVEADCNWLRLLFSWASKWRTQTGHYLLRENPVRGFDVPREENPRRPVATQDRFETLRAVSDSVDVVVSWAGKQEERRSYLSELLDVANGTGRRISAVCKLRYEDLRLTPTQDAPHGAIRWPADTDKTGRETIAPITPDVRRALERVMQERPGIGAAPLFPLPSSRNVPMTRYLADKWLREAERLAGLEPQRGSLWHAYRRKWATERKDFSDVDVAAAGGWKSLQALKDCYQQADVATMYRVVMGGEELREAR